METYEAPAIVASFDVEEIVEEAAVCTGGYHGGDYGGYKKKKWWSWFGF